MPFTVARTINIDMWDEPCRNKVRAFWENHRMVFSDAESDSLVGKRGWPSWSFSPQSVPATLRATITISSLEPSKIDCVLTVSTAWNVWTIWDSTAFELEISIFEKFMTTNDCCGDLWRDFVSAYHLHFWMTNLSCGLMGMTMSEADKREFRQAAIIKSSGLNCLRAGDNTSSQSASVESKWIYESAEKNPP